MQRQHKCWEREEREVNLFRDGTSGICIGRGEGTPIEKLE